MLVKEYHKFLRKMETWVVKEYQFSRILLKKILLTLRYLVPLVNRNQYKSSKEVKLTGLKDDDDRCETNCLSHKPLD